MNLNMHKNLNQLAELIFYIISYVKHLPIMNKIVKC